MQVIKLNNIAKYSIISLMTLPRNSPICLYQTPEKERLWTLGQNYKRGSETRD